MGCQPNSCPTLFWSDSGYHLPLSHTVQTHSDSMRTWTGDWTQEFRTRNRAYPKRVGFLTTTYRERTEWGRSDWQVYEKSQNLVPKLGVSIFSRRSEDAALELHSLSGRWPTYFWQHACSSSVVSSRALCADYSGRDYFESSYHVANYTACSVLDECIYTRTSRNELQNVPQHTMFSHHIFFSFVLIYCCVSASSFNTSNLSIHPIEVLPTYFLMRWDSSVGIATPTGWKAGVRFTAGARDFSLLLSVQSGSWAHSASYTRVPMLLSRG
jgi:hypothetical protein